MNKDLGQLHTDMMEVWQHYSKQGTTPWNYRTAVADMPYQVGSLTKAVMQLNNERYHDGLSEKGILANIADELVDILAEVLFIANELNIDLYDAWETMLESDKKKISERSTDQNKHDT